MITVISPAKALDFSTKSEIKLKSNIAFEKEAEFLVREMQKLLPPELEQLMKISRNLSELNHERFLTWKLPFNLKNAKQALLAFNGEVYNGIQAKTLDEKGLKFAQNHLRILSGLYGVLRPLDLIQAYRLEMGTKKEFGGSKNLYEFWKEKITANLNKEFEKIDEPVLVNLASNEYFKSIDKKKLKATIITPQFKQSKDGTYKMVAIFAKKARGLMSRFIIDNEITDVEELKAFNIDGYFFNNELSSGNNWVFTRSYQ